jgi:hypothetical protein
LGVWLAGIAGASAILRAPEQATVARRDANILDAYERWAQINDIYSFSGMTPEQIRSQVFDFAAWLDGIKGAAVPVEIVRRLRQGDTEPAEEPGVPGDDPEPSPGPGP